MFFVDFNIFDFIDVTLVSILIFQLYKLVRGSAAINIFIGMMLVYIMWKIFSALEMSLLSEILGQFISVGVLALIIVFQQEIRKFLLLIGSTNFASRRNVVRYFNFSNQDKGTLKLDLTSLLNACEKMASEKTGAIIVLQRSNTLDFTLNESNITQIKLTPQVLETIF